MKKLTALFLSVAMCGTLLAGCGSSKSDEAQASDTNETTAEETTDASSEEDTELLTGLHHVTIDVKDYGTFLWNWMQTLHRFPLPILSIWQKMDFTTV